MEAVVGSRLINIILWSRLSEVSFNTEAVSGGIFNM
jgi:hypothetical protein